MITTILLSLVAAGVPDRGGKKREEEKKRYEG